MPTFDLSSLKTQIETSAGNISKLGTDLVNNTTSALNSVVPGLSELPSSIAKTATSLADAAKSLGTSIQGAAMNAVPAMNNVLKGLTPDLGSLRANIEGVADKIRSTLAPVGAKLTDTLSALTSEVDKVAAAVNSASTSITSSQQRGPSIPQELQVDIGTTYEVPASYAEGLAAYLYDPSGPLPAFDPTQLNVDQLVATATENKYSMVDAAAGAMTSTIYRAAAFLRENALRYRNKAYLYDQGVAEATVAAQEERARSGLRTAELRGTTPSQVDGG